MVLLGLATNGAKPAELTPVDRYEACLLGTSIVRIEVYKDTSNYFDAAVAACKPLAKGVKSATLDSVEEWSNAFLFDLTQQLQVPPK